MCASEDPAALMIEAWCAPTLVSPAGRPCSVIQLAMRQAAGPVDIGDPYLEDEQWDMEAMVLATISGELHWLIFRFAPPTLTGLSFPM